MDLTFFFFFFTNDFGRLISINLDISNMKFSGLHVQVLPFPSSQMGPVGSTIDHWEALPHPLHLCVSKSNFDLDFILPKVV